jgi:hypothetical protein
VVSLAAMRKRRISATAGLSQGLTFICCDSELMTSNALRGLSAKPYRGNNKPIALVR